MWLDKWPKSICNLCGVMWDLCCKVYHIDTCVSLQHIWPTFLQSYQVYSIVIICISSHKHVFDYVTYISAPQGVVMVSRRLLYWCHATQFEKLPAGACHSHAGYLRTSLQHACQGWENIEVKPLSLNQGPTLNFVYSLQNNMWLIIIIFFPNPKLCLAPGPHSRQVKSCLMKCEEQI
jgi:hypothetical protein